MGDLLSTSWCCLIAAGCSHPDGLRCRWLLLGLGGQSPCQGAAQSILSSCNAGARFAETIWHNPSKSSKSRQEHLGGHGHEGSHRGGCASHPGGASGGPGQISWGPPCIDKKAVEGAMFSSCFFKMRGHVLSAHIKSSLYPKSLLIMVVWAL